jgi:hypothetical protein
MKLRVRSLIGSIIGGVLLAAVPAGATSVTWDGSNGSTVYGAWVTDVTGTPTELSFPTSASCPGGSGAICAGGSATLGSFTISGTGLNVNYDSSNRNAPGFESSTVTVTTPAGGINAFLIEVGASTSPSPVTIALSDGEMITSVNSSELDAPTFFAISISHEITSFSISTASGNVFLDDLFYGASSLTQDGGTGDGGTGGDTSQTSEAATVLMIGGGLLALLGSRRKWVARFAA